MIRRLFHLLEAWVRHPGEQLSRWRRMLVASGRLFIFISRQLGRDRCLQQSAALAYKTILSLVPILVISFLLFRSVGGLRDLGEKVQGFVFTSLNVDSLVITAGEGAASRPISLSREINDRLEVTYRNLDVGAIGVVGILFLVLAATSLLGQMDEALNQVWKTPSKRTFWVRLTTYWTVITIGPILLGASFYLAGRVQSEFSQVRLFAFVERVVGFVLPIAAAWLALFLAYTLVPNTSVRRRSAAIGALVAACMFEVAKRAFALYVTELVPYSKTYGALALLPIFLVWLNLLWVIFLFGAELAYSLQNVGALGAGAGPRGLGLVPGGALAVNALFLIAQRFRRGGRPLSVPALARRLHAGAQEVQDVARLLADRGFASRLVGRRERYQLARAPESIPIADVLDAAGERFAQPLPDRPTGEQPDRLADLYARLTSANRAALADATLADLLSPSPIPGA